MKTLSNTPSNPQENVKDLVTWGDSNTFKLIAKAYSKPEGWMKSTKAMEIEGVGCVVQVTTQQHNEVAEALTFVPGVKIEEFTDETGNVTGRRLVKGERDIDIIISEFKTMIDGLLGNNTGGIQLN